MKTIINEARNQTKIGKVITVLCEDYDPVSETHFGRSGEDAPEIDGKVYFRSEKRIAPGSFVQVKIREVLDYDLMGRAISLEKTLTRGKIEHKRRGQQRIR